MVDALKNEKHWLFVLETADRPGVAASVTAAFSGRGITIENLMGYRDWHDPNRPRQSHILVSFRAVPERKEWIERAARRLPTVRSVRSFEYNDPRLRKSVMIRIPEEKKQEAESILLEEEGVQHCWTDAPEGCAIALLHGQVAPVDRATESLERIGAAHGAAGALLLP